ncbi:hypothetical protein E5N72_17840 [Pseudoalteromonas sp. MEBiC 03607]|uniref:hypothetical protein n=1 Tax=unclassified Pseudoalteromonas TaxID=194690 RepID=UPI001093D4FC|nr:MULTISPECIES: hypothetical protein [unclassified Pseudoalteromonas]TGV17094.1 hypothetical protein E5N72_17840 [Pseudoalteromonas sp. MEBiC 03607]TMO41203.1 hypothetical protein CWC25_19340 [Pseudoalteromonas sp. S4389]
MKSVFSMLICVLLLQPLLDSFDVADHNTAFNYTSVLLLEEVDLETHCAANGDHQLHQSEHAELATKLADSAEKGHCHVCHSPAFVESLAFSKPISAYFTKIESLSVDFQSADLTPIHRPPITSLT